MRRCERRVVVALVAAGVLSAWPGAAAAATPSGQGPLAGNGFASPLCEDLAGATRLGASAQANCAASGVVAAPAPVSNYQFDVHIDTGVFGVNADVVVQDLILTPSWTALVWLVHALIVALEWCYSLDLLNGGPLRQLGDALRSAHAAFTQPWLGFALAIAAILLAYEGIVRRRVADSLGRAAMTLAMILGGLWLIADPAGTVGTISRGVNDAGLGTVAAISGGTPAHAQRSFAAALGDLFTTAVTGPWCYLEFGDVGWCTDPARLDPRLRAAAARIAADDRGAAACRQTAGATGSVACAGQATRTATALRTEAALLDAGRSNGQYFLALAPNSALRNSINDPRSLLRVICAGADMGSCSGPSAAAAQFRTPSGTWARAGGLLFIAIGTAGMLALLGFLVMRLLAAALLSVLYLLLAPVAVLAPALGDGGRSAFRAWSARLLGALVAKLVYSILLGAVLLMLRILVGLDALGWWTQWLLVASFWWIVFAHRHRLLSHVFTDEPRHVRYPIQPGGAARMLLRAAGGGLRGALGAIDRTYRPGPIRDPRPAPVERPKPAPGGDGANPTANPTAPTANPIVTPSGEAGPRTPTRDAARTALDEQLRRLLAHERAAVAAEAAAASDPAAAAAADRRRDRLAGALDVAERAGDSRRAASLRMRLHRLDEGRAAAREARARASSAASPRQALDELARRRAAELDSQARLAPAKARAVPAAGASRTSARRDYEALTGLAGIARTEYLRMQPADRRRARLEIDRELERRREWSDSAAAASGEPPGDQAEAPVTPPRDQAEMPVTPPRQGRSRRQRQFTRREFEDLLD